MGASTSLHLIDANIELLRETKDFARWALSDVTQLHQRFQKTFGFALTEAQFEDLVLLKAPETLSIKEIFSVLDTNRDGRIDGLEFLAALTCVCRATFEEKARFSFELFDFNMNGSLSVTELALLMKSVWMGMSMLTGRHQMNKSTVAFFLTLAQSAFEKYDKDQSDALSYEEFIEWARSNREFMLQVEQFRLISEKAIGFEEEVSLPDGSDVDSDVDDELEFLCSDQRPKPTNQNEEQEEGVHETRLPELPQPWNLEPTTKTSIANALEMPPPVNLALEWIYGVKGPSARNICRYLCNGNVVYVVSKYAIVYNVDRHQQQYYQRHEHEIMCMDVHPLGEIVATGDRPASTSNKSPEIHLWNGVTMQSLVVLQNFHVGGIAYLSFPAPASAASSTLQSAHTAAAFTQSMNSSLIKKKAHAESLLVSIGSDANSSMALWDWQKETLVASGRAHGSKQVLAVALNEDGNEVLVCGKHFILFHSLEGRFFKQKKPRQMEKRVKTVPSCLSAAYYAPQQAVVGTTLGTLLQFHQMTLIKVIQAHGVHQSINCCLLSCRSMVLFTAGKDGLIKQWDSTLLPIGNPIDLHALHSAGNQTVLNQEDWRISSLAYDPFRQRLLIGTRHAQIVEIQEKELIDNASPPLRIIASGHGGHAINGLATARFGVCFVSCGETDRTIKLWNLRRRMQQKQLRLRFAPSSVAFSNDGELLAVGGADGSIAMVQAKTLTMSTIIKNTNARVVLLRFAPQDDLVSVACANGLIYLYQVFDKTGSRLKRYALLKSPNVSLVVTSLDFSVDGRFLKSQHGPSSLQFWDLRHHACSRISAMNFVRNIRWQTFSSTIGWHVSGLAPQVQWVSASTSQTMACTMNGAGRLAITHFPCDARSKRHVWLEKSMENAHSMTDASAAIGGFALHDSLLVTSSQSDGAICQWRVEQELPDEQTTSKRFELDRLIKQQLQDFGVGDVYAGWDDPIEIKAHEISTSNHLPAVTTAIATTSVASIERKEAPDIDLSLSYAHGMNQSRQSIACAGNGTIVYGCGSLLVTCHALQRKQLQVLQSGLSHSVSCIVRHPFQRLVALCSLQSPRILVWDLASMSSIAAIEGEASRKPLYLAFGGQDGQLLAVVWKERHSNRHVLSMYAWKKQKRIAEVDMTCAPVLFGVFADTVAPSNVCFVSGGVNHVTFWQLNGTTGHLTSQNGAFGRHALVDTTTCALLVSPFVLTGTMKGKLILWEHGCAAFTLDLADSGSLLSLAHVSSRQQSVGVTINGWIHVWSYGKEANARIKPSEFLQPLRRFHLQDLEWKQSIGAPPQTKESLRVVGTCLQDELHGLIIQLDRGVVLHVDAMLFAHENANNNNKPMTKVLVETDDERTDLALHPRDQVFATTSERGAICVYSLSTNTMMAMRQMETAAKALAYKPPKGDNIAVSLANGTIMILHSQTLETISEFPCGTTSTAMSGPMKWSHRVQFSPVNGQHLAVACRDFNIYVYKSTDAAYELVHVLAGHTSRIESLDFSCDGTWLQSSTNVLDKQVLRWHLDDPSASKTCSLADQDWCSWTNAFVGPVAGLTEVVGARVSALDRVQTMDSNATTWSSKIPVIAVGTEQGELLLHWYPFPSGRSKTAVAKEYHGFVPQDAVVSHIRFSGSNAFVVTSARQYDGSSILLVWKTDYEEELLQLDRHLYHKSTTTSDVPQQNDPDPVWSALERQTKDKGDEFMAVKPWLGAIREPSNPLNVNQGEAPDQELLTDFVYGLNMTPTGRCDVFYADDAWEIVYAAAGFGVVYNTKTQSQLFNQAHGHQLVSALAVHPQGNIIATGECGVKNGPKLVLWDANSGSTIAELVTSHARGICLVGFSQNGSRLASIGMDDDHTLSLYAISTGDGMTRIKHLSSMKTSKQLVLGLSLGDDQELVTCGLKHILFWESLTSGASTTLSMKKGLMSSHKLSSANARVICATFVAKNHVISGQGDGSLYVWKGRNCVDVKKDAHTAAVTSVFVDRKRQLVFSGGKDGRIGVWNQHLESVRTIDLQSLKTQSIKLVSTAIASLCVRDGRILISTETAEICEVVPDTPNQSLANADSVYRLQTHLRGHFKGELWGLDAHPLKMQFVTAGDDGSIRLWDAPTRQLLGMYLWKNTSARAIAFSSDGSHIAVGSTNGKVLILNEALDKAVMEWKCSAKAIQVIKYSPDNSTLAIGCHDQKIYIYDAHSCKKKGECRGHSSTITHMDFSKDGNILQSTSNAYELLFWSVGGAVIKQIPSSTEVRDVQWATWTCPFGWPAQGIWPSASDGSDINAVCRSQDGKLLVTTDDRGDVKLFKYPCTKPQAKYRSYVGHSSHSTNAAFTMKDMFVLSTGGLDNVICQFRCRSAIAKGA